TLAAGGEKSTYARCAAMGDCRSAWCDWRSGDSRQLGMLLGCLPTTSKRLNDPIGWRHLPGVGVAHLPARRTATLRLGACGHRPWILVASRVRYGFRLGALFYAK